MKFITSILLTALLGYAITLYLPWWTFAVTSLIVAIFIHQSPGRAFLSGFIALALLWGIHAAILDSANNGILAQKIAYVFMLNGSRLILLLLTAIIGGLISAFAALSGSFARKTIY